MDVTEPVVFPTTVEFDPFSDDFFNAPFNTYRRLRDEAPVYHNEKYGFWALSRYEDVEPALKDFETYSSAGVSRWICIWPNLIRRSRR